MSDPETYGFPHIPLSQIREIYRIAKLYLEEGGFDAKELGRLLLREKISQLYAEYWYAEVDRLRKENSILRKKIGYADYPGTEITTLSIEEWNTAYLGEED